MVMPRRVAVASQQRKDVVLAAVARAGDEREVGVATPPLSGAVCECADARRCQHSGSRQGHWEGSAAALPQPATPQSTIRDWVILPGPCGLSRK
jgi:hypothetical protein